MIRAEHEVVGLDSNLYSRCTYSARGEICELPTIHKDARDVEVDDLVGFDGILHLAALSNDPLGNLKPSLTDEINHRASVRLAELANKRAGVSRFVFASSCSNYGQAPAEDVFNESFNVGQTAHNYRIRDLAEIVASVVPECTIEFADDTGPDKRSDRVSFEKIRRKLSAFEPRWDACMGAEQLYIKRKPRRDCPGGM